MDHVVLDVEIAKTVEEVGGWDNTHLMGVSVACVWEYATQRMRVYGPEDVEELRRRLLKADRISGYNILNFDFPVIWGVSKGEWKDAGLPPMPLLTETDRLSSCAELKQKLLPKTDDILRRIWQALGLNADRFAGHTHGGWKLEDVARATLGKGKIGNGADAPKWYQAGQVQRVVNYCCDDVCLERDLADFIDRYGYVVGRDGQQVFIKKWLVGW
jgi:DEAD/DEAH box helicase domain-containing protein